jgi:hypothetical protein
MKRKSGCERGGVSSMRTVYRFPGSKRGHDLVVDAPVGVLDPDASAQGDVLAFGEARPDDAGERPVSEEERPVRKIAVQVEDLLGAPGSGEFGGEARHVCSVVTRLRRGRSRGQGVYFTGTPAGPSHVGSSV